MFDKKSYQKEWRKNNPEKVKYYEKHRKERKQYMKEYSKKYYSENKIQHLEKMKEYVLRNKKKVEAYKRKWCKDNSERIVKKVKVWREQNPEKYKKHSKEYTSRLYHTDLKYNINYRMAIAIGISLKGNKNGKHWEALVGYSMLDLKRHLQKTMPKGYTWQDYINGELHIDHIIPKNAFEFTKPEDINFKRCWALGNLRLLPAKENIRKSNKIIKPFQQLLKI
jgi:hypothetical protein